VSERSTTVEPNEPCGGVKSVGSLEVDTDVADEKMPHLLLYFKGLLNADWWVALVAFQYHTATMRQTPPTFFKSADFAAFNRFQQPIRYSKTVWSVGTLDKKK
jgi:hypothetical protein